MCSNIEFSNMLFVYYFYLKFKAVIVLSTVYLIIRPSDVEAVKNTVRI